MTTEPRTQYDEACTVCGRPIGDGDEAGWVQTPDGDMIPNCSEACAETYFTSIGVIPMTTTARTQAYAYAVLADVYFDIDSGLIPPTVTSFAELQDYVDANVYLTTMSQRGTTEEHLAELNRITDLVSDALKARNA